MFDIPSATLNVGSTDILHFLMFCCSKRSYVEADTVVFGQELALTEY